jgi:hypothetical protein
LPANSGSAFQLRRSAGESAKMSRVAVRGQPFSSALRIEVTAKPRGAADVQIAAPAGAPMASGDVWMVSFLDAVRRRRRSHARRQDSAPGQELEAQLEQ